MFSKETSENLNDPRFIPQSIRLMDQVREVLHYHHYAIRTEEVYVRWIAAFIRFNHRKHPKDLGKHEIEAFLSDLAVNKNCAQSTQSQALNAIIFLYKKVLDLPVSEELVHSLSKKPVQLPVVMSRNEVEQVLKYFSGTNDLIARLMYSAGFRVIEIVRLRVQDFDFENRLIQIRNSRGNTSRSTLFIESLKEPVRHHLEKGRSVLDEDVVNGHANVWLPMHSIESILMQAKNGFGNMLYHLKKYQLTPGQGLKDDITWMNQMYRKRCVMRFLKLVLLNALHYILFDTPL